LITPLFRMGKARKKVTAHRALEQASHVPAATEGNKQLLLQRPALERTQAPATSLRLGGRFVAD
jgi:hypothetical protein